MKKVLYIFLSLVMIASLCSCNGGSVKTTETANTFSAQTTAINNTKTVINDDIKNKYDGYKLSWNDEFDGTGINSDNWSFESGYVRNNEPQYYTDSEKNARIENSNLILEAHNDDSLYGYTSASILSKGKFSFYQGILEVKAKLPKGNGVWPAIWMMGDVGDHNDVITGSEWPYTGEIDIMELVGGSNGDNKVEANLHWGDPITGKTYGLNDNKDRLYYLENGTFNDAYHIFKFEWTETDMIWYVDDTEIFRYDITDETMFGFHNCKQYILLNLALGAGGWSGKPDDTTPFPVQYKIDYVRCYQKSK